MPMPPDLLKPDWSGQHILFYKQHKDKIQHYAVSSEQNDGFILKVGISYRQNLYKKNPDLY